MAIRKTSLLPLSIAILDPGLKFGPGDSLLSSLLKVLRGCASFRFCCWPCSSYGCSSTPSAAGNGFGSCSCSRSVLSGLLVFFLGVSRLALGHARLRIARRPRPPPHQGTPGTRSITSTRRTIIRNSATFISNRANWNRPKPAYRAAMERDPQDIDTRAHLGQCLLREKRPAEARPLLEGVIAENPKHDYGHTMMALAETLTALGETGERARKSGGTSPKIIPIRAPRSNWRNSTPPKTSRTSPAPNSRTCSPTTPMLPPSSASAIGSGSVAGEVCCGS